MAIAVGTIALIAILILLSPIFRIQEVFIVGIERVNESEVRERLNLNYTSNIFLLNTNTVRTRIMGNPYVANVTFRRELPNTIHIIVHERRLSAYMEHMPGSFLFLDDFGHVLEVRSSFTEPLPLLVGLSFTRFQVGEILDVPIATNFAAVVQYTQSLAAHGLLDQITHINVSDPSNIRILVNYLDFHVGTAQNADEKVRTIAEMLKTFPDPTIIRGSVDIREIRAEYFLTLLQ